MRVLVIGSGGREHALAWKLRQSGKVTQLYCAPGNPGMEIHAECVPIKATDQEALLSFSREKDIDLVVVGPERPLAEGIVDLFEANGLSVFGPSKAAARLEWSKAWAKEFMQRHRIPTAGYKLFRSGQTEEAVRFIESHIPPVVIKADGLAAGKGVSVCDSHSEAHTILVETLGNEGGGDIVVEEFLDGVEASVFAVTDGKDFVILSPAQDHKRALDDDKGKNTGGMGAYAPASVVTPEILNEVISQILIPTLEGMRKEGVLYRGCLYLGLMLTRTGPKVIEFNCRFGDPETQVVLPLYNGDLFELLLASTSGDIASIPSSSFSGSAVCVVLASGGYPDAYSTGYEIEGIDQAELLPGVMVFHAGTSMENQRILTAGGRVLGVTAVQEDGTIDEAIRKAYQGVEKISFRGMQYRKDIGRKVVSRYLGVV